MHIFTHHLSQRAGCDTSSISKSEYSWFEFKVFFLLLPMIKNKVYPTVYTLIGWMEKG